MSLRGWLRERLRRKSPAPVNLVDRPDIQVPPPERLGLDLHLRVMPWSAARLASIFSEAERFLLKSEFSVNPGQPVSILTFTLFLFSLKF
jgi:hypothetical protein